MTSKRLYQRLMKTLLTLVVVGLLAVFNPPQTSLVKQETITPFPSPSITLGVVERVVDGDTIVVKVNDVVEKIRLIGVDTPEVVDPRKLVQCFGKEASAKTKEILENQTVRLEDDISQGNRDKYGRLLRYVFLEDGTNFNLLLIKEGFAHEYTYRLPYKYQTEFKQAQKDARLQEKGLWAKNACEKY